MNDENFILLKCQLQAFAILQNLPLKAFVREAEQDCHQINSCNCTQCDCNCTFFFSCQSNQAIGLKSLPKAFASSCSKQLSYEGVQL